MQLDPRIRVVGLNHLSHKTLVVAVVHHNILVKQLVTAARTCHARRRHWRRLDVWVHTAQVRAQRPRHHQVLGGNGAHVQRAQHEKTQVLLELVRLDEKRVLVDVHNHTFLLGIAAFTHSVAHADRKTVAIGGHLLTPCHAELGSYTGRLHRHHAPVLGQNAKQALVRLHNHTNRLGIELHQVLDSVLPVGHVCARQRVCGLDEVVGKDTHILFALVTQ